MTEPRTEAGRALLERVVLAATGDHHAATDQWRAGAEAVGHDLEGSILAIEAEALASAAERVRGLEAALTLERAKTADVLGARDILRDWLDGHDHGFPVHDDQWEPDIAERARAILGVKP